MQIFVQTCSVLLLLLASSNVVRAAEMQYPVSVAAPEKGPVYVADRKLPGIWSVQDGKVSSFYKGSKVFRTPLNAVRCVTLDEQGRVIAGDSATREVYRFEKAGAKPTPLTNGGIGIPMDVVVTKAGDLLVSDLELHRIWKVPAAGGKPTLFAEVSAPRGLALDQAGNLWVVSGTADQLLKVTPDGKVSVVVKGRPFNFPHDVVVLDDGTAVVSDGYEKTLWKVTLDGKTEKWVSGEPLINPVGIALQGKNILVADPHAKTVFSVDAEKKVTDLLSSEK
ncbi:Serine/threonine-protein kinase PknD [Gimesia panareensis]|uniref:Serine/threonine-protein kinase PknD n=1 Tax=Gimesia panareensis TaxID=2527978 RepID=A0A518FH83_9PLAN|nr:SMP-30/gluconolactonase/LRE family protein [Gimesia panareensis]QDV15705.1 Serine/threonine-protein kinase PknD [Gimesia panareensis]